MTNTLETAPEAENAQQEAAPGTNRIGRQMADGRNRMQGALNRGGAGQSIVPASAQQGDNSFNIDPQKMQEKMKELQDGFDKRLSAIEEKKETNGNGSEDSLRKKMYEHVRGPLGKILKYGPVVMLPPLAALPLGHELLKRTPLLNKLYPGRLIDTIGDKTRNAIALTLTAPLVVTAIPAGIKRGLYGEKGIKYAGPIGDWISEAGRKIGHALRFLWKPGKAVGLIDGTIERLAKATEWTFKNTKDGIVGLAKGFGELITIPFKIVDTVLDTLGLTKGIVRGGLALVGGAALLSYYPALLEGIKGWFMHTVLPSILPFV